MQSGLAVQKSGTTSVFPVEIVIRIRAVGKIGFPRFSEWIKLTGGRYLDIANVISSGGAVERGDPAPHAGSQVVPERGGLSTVGECDTDGNLGGMANGGAPLPDLRELGRSQRETEFTERMLLNQN